MNAITSENIVGGTKVRGKLERNTSQGQENWEIKNAEGIAEKDNEFVAIQTFEFLAPSFRADAE